MHLVPRPRPEGIVSRRTDQTPEVRLAAMLSDEELFEELFAARIEARRTANRRDHYFAALACEAGRRWFRDRKLAREAA